MGGELTDLVTALMTALTPPTPPCRLDSKTLKERVRVGIAKTTPLPHGLRLVGSETQYRTVPIPPNRCNPEP